MQNLIFLIKTWFTQGSENQSFIGARWVATMIRFTPSVWRRSLVLRVLAWSPHYFYRDIAEANQRMSTSEFLESEFQRNRQTRIRIRDEILAQHLVQTHDVLDYGCGPGFLAVSVAEKVTNMTALDVSRGVIECAKTLNSAHNLRYLHTSEVAKIDANSIDLVYSFAVIQHVTDSVFGEILGNAYRVMKPGSKLVFHVVLEAQGWRDQQSWEADKSLTGRVKLNYGLNCFSRDTQSIKSLLGKHGFSSPAITPISDLCTDHFDDICEQHLLIAEKV